MAEVRSRSHKNHNFQSPFKGSKNPDKFIIPERIEKKSRQTNAFSQNSDINEEFETKKSVIEVKYFFLSVSFLLSF